MYSIQEDNVSKVVCEISMSLDGFITGPNVRVGNGMGDNGDRLHDWMFDAKTETDAKIVDETYASSGAIIIGKRMFEVGFELWGDPPPFRMPVFIVTHEERESLRMQGGTTYAFVTDGIEAALKRARAAAGDKNVGVWAAQISSDSILKPDCWTRYRFTISLYYSATASGFLRVSTLRGSN
jgi:dihydrofolate reductase